jgi:alginate O-acetyltransferase complex protein AlgJ
MQSIYRSARLALPVLFLAYGGFATAYMLREGHLVVQPTDTPLSGGLTTQIDAVYRDDLPLRDVAVGLVGATRYSLIGEGRPGVLAGQDGWLFTTEEAEEMAEDMAQPVAHIAALRDQLAAMGTELVLVPLPAKTDIEAARAANPGLSRVLAQRHAAFLQVLNETGVPAVDIRPAMLALAGQGQAFYATDTHWTAEGAAAAARAIAADLQARGLAPDAQVYAQTLDPVEGFTGDLVSYVTTPRFAPLVGLDPETATPIRAVAAAPDGLSASDLFGSNSGGGVALVGTSYSANARWSFTDSLILALGADVVNHAEEGQGPVRPVYAMLADPTFTEAPPAVVIWEFPIRFLADPTIWDPQTLTPEGSDHDT